MKRVFFAVLALALVAGFAPSQSFAQATPQAAPKAPQGGGGGRGAPAPPQQIDTATAKKMVAAVEAAATALNDHVAICIMDARGDMAFFERMDTLDLTPVSTSQGKARAVLMMGIPTGQIADAISAGKPVPVAIKKTMPGTGEVVFMRGGLPIMKDGKLIGAIGVGGSANDNDEKYAQIGIDAMTK
jgi:glc operon protein GlcG